MNNIPKEYLFEILKYIKNYKECIQIIFTCKNIYNINPIIKKYYTNLVNINGSKFYYLDHEFHREDGPAIQLRNGKNIWFVYNKLVKSNW